MSHQNGSCRINMGVSSYPVGFSTFLAILTSQINETIPILLGHVSTRRGFYVTISRDYVPIRRFHYVPLEWKLSHQYGCQFLPSRIQYFLAILTSQINETIPIFTIGTCLNKKGPLRHNKLGLCPNKKVSLCPIRMGVVTSVWVSVLIQSDLVLPGHTNFPD